MFFARYAAKLAICCPFALLCYLPLSGFLRLPLKKLAAFGALGVTAFVGIGALACCRFQLSVNALLFPALLLFLLLYLKSVALPPSKALFVFFPNPRKLQCVSVYLRKPRPWKGASRSCRLPVVIWCDTATRFTCRPARDSRAASRTRIMSASA